jgi:hypothetical protein
LQDRKSSRRSRDANGRQETSSGDLMMLCIDIGLPFYSNFDIHSVDAFVTFVTLVTLVTLVIFEE